MELKKPSWKSFNKPIVWVSLFAIAFIIATLITPEKNPTSLTFKIRTVTTALCVLLLIRDSLISLTSDQLSIGRLFAKFVACVLVIRFGPWILNDLYLQSTENIETSIAIGLSILALVALNQITDVLELFLEPVQDWAWKNKRKPVGGQENGLETAWVPKLCTSNDIYVTCIHEAGHALVYAALPNIPDQFRMKALPQSDSKGRLGFVSSVEWPEILKPKDFLLIQLLLYLAGQQAERCILGEIFDGSHSDLRYWQQESKNYLKSGFGELYFSPVENDYEAEQNRLTLERLRNEQSDLLSRFFQANQEVLQDLAKELLTKGKLLKAEVEPFLSQVQLIDGFPRL